MARRRHAAEVAAHNQRVAEERAQQQRLAQKEQRQCEQDNIKSEVGIAAGMALCW